MLNSSILDYEAQLFQLIGLCVVAQGGKKSKSGEGLLQWDCEREKVLQALVQLLQLDIRSLWSLSLVEEEFIRYSSEGRALGKSTVSGCGNSVSVSLL